MNPYKRAWMEEVNLIYNPTTHDYETNTSSPDISGHIGGTALLAGSYIGASLLIKSGNPYAVAVGGAILLVPDPVIYAVGYWIFD